MSSPESTLHIKRADLPPAVRSYADKLQAECRALLREYGVSSPDDLKRLPRDKNPENVLRRYRDLSARLREAVRSGELPPEDLEFTEDYEDPETGKTREIRLDLTESLKTTSDFFHTFGLDELRVALPKSIHLTDEQKELVRKKMREGFDLAFVLPPPKVFEAALEHVVEATSKVVTRVSRGYGVSFYTGGFSSSANITRKNYHGVRRDQDDPYIFLVKNKNWGPAIGHEALLVGVNITTTAHLQEFIQRRGETGFTLEEYLLFHRFFVETHKGEHPENLTSTLLPSSIPGNHAILRAGWACISNPDDSKFFLSVDQVTATGNGVRGCCRTAVVIPLR